MTREKKQKKKKTNKKKKKKKTIQKKNIRKGVITARDTKWARNTEQLLFFLPLPSPLDHVKALLYSFLFLHRVALFVSRPSWPMAYNHNVV